MKARYLLLALPLAVAYPLNALAFDPLLDDLPDPPLEKKDQGSDPGLEDMLNIVVVTATKKAQSIGAAPAIITVVTGGQIARRGYRDVGEALRSVAGLYSFHDHINYNMGVRGINGGQRAYSRIVKLMIDGHPVAFRPSSENWMGPELIPVDAISRIEIIRGPASALYGANAFLGVINIITKTGEQLNGALVRGGLNFNNNNPGGGGELVVGLKKGDVDVLVSATGEFANRSGLTIADVPGQTTYFDPGVTIDPVPSGEEPPSNHPTVDRVVNRLQSKDDKSIRSSVFARASYQNDTLGMLNVDFSYQRLDVHAEFADWGPLLQSRLGTATLPAGATPIPDYKYNRIALDNMYGRVRLARPFAGDFSASISAAFARMGPTSSDHMAIDQSGLGDFFTRDIGTTGIDLIGELSYTLKEINNLSIGVDFTWDKHTLQTFFRHDIDPAGGPESVTATGGNGELGDKTFTNLGAYFQSVLYPFQLLGSTALNELGLTLGVRYDHHNVYGDVPNFRAGLIYLKSGISAKALFGTSFKAPSSVQLFTTPLGVGSLRGNPNLDPERAKTVDVMLGAQIVRGLNVSVTGYFTKVDDKVEFVIDPVTGDVKAENNASVTSVGIESDLQLVWRQLAGFANFTVQKSTLDTNGALDDAQGNATGVFGAAKVRLYPTYTFKFGAGYRIPQIFLGAYLEGRLVGSRYASEPNSAAYDPVFNQTYELASYFEMDAALTSHNLKLFGDRETRLTFKVSNLTGSDFLVPGFRNFDIPNIGRTFFLSLSQEI